VKYTEKDLEAAVSKVFKILGKDADVPYPEPNPAETIEDSNKLRTEVTKARDALVKLVDDYETSIDKVKNVAKSYSNKLSKEKFGLEDTKPDDKKKIIQARKIILDEMKEIDKQCNDSLKVLADIDKAISPTIT
jgi:hypothetical protein